MAYRRPFTAQQRREAIRAYRSFRKHRSILRKFYPPASPRQREILREYGDVIGEMASELRKDDADVHVVALTRADAAARWLAMEYWRINRTEH